MLRHSIYNCKNIVCLHVFKAVGNNIFKNYLFIFIYFNFKILVATMKGRDHSKGMARVEIGR